MQARKNRRRRLAALLAPLVLVGGLAGRMVYCVGDDGHQAIEAAHPLGDCHHDVAGAAVADPASARAAVAELADTGAAAVGCDDIAFGVVTEGSACGSVLLVGTAGEPSASILAPPQRHAASAVTLNSFRHDVSLTVTVLRL